MKHKHCKFLCTVLLLLCSAVASAQLKVDGIFYYIVSGSAEVTSGSSKYTGNVVIPNSFTYYGTTYIVTSIRSGAFSNCSGLTSITIPNSVTSIGDSAFSGCSGLTSMTIPNSVIGIGDYTFEYCSGFISITIGSSVTRIGDYAFSGCTGLTNIEIPNSVRSIGANAFNGCYRLKSIEIPNSVTSIGNFAFDGCSALISVVIPNGVTSIGNRTFANCSKLTSVVIPNSVNIIENAAFSKCYALKSIEIPNSVTGIGNYAFNGCSSLEVVINFSNLTFSKGSSNNGYIAYYANKVINAPNGFIDGDFIWLENNSAVTLAAYLGNATELILPTDYDANSITSIGDYAFSNCSDLTSITIPNSITSIGDYAFSGCSNLVNITIPNSVTSIGADVFDGTIWYNNQPTGVVYVGKVLYKYKGTVPENTSIIIKDGTLGIAGKAFYNCSNLIDVEIPNSVTNIGNYAFDGCSSLKDVHVSDLVSWCNIDFKNFAANPLYYTKNFYLNGEAITALVIPYDVTEIKNYVFCGYTGLTSVVIGDGVTSIGDSAFSGCTGLTNIEIPNSITSIGADAFYGCKGFTNIVIPNSITTIGESAFRNCTGLTSVEFNATNCISMGSYTNAVFRECTKFSRLIIGENVRNIPDYAFYYCDALTSVTSLIPADNVFAVNTYLFNGIEKLYVPYGAKEIYAATKGWNEFVDIVELDPTEITVTINEYGCATYCSPFSLDFSNLDGLKAYAATGYNTSTGMVTLTRQQTTQPGMGLFISGVPGVYTVPVLEYSNDCSLNMLVGVLERTSVNSTSDDGVYYNYKYTVMSGDDTPKFYRFSDNSTLSAGKAYLQIPSAWLKSSQTKTIAIRFDDGETTGIDEVEHDDIDFVYDLQGRRVEKPANGIYIVNGKKVIIK